MGKYITIPDCLLDENIRTFFKLTIKGKSSYISVIFVVLYLYQHKLPTSYAAISKITKWHRRDIKSFLNHIGIDISTKKNIRHKGYIVHIQPIKSQKYSENIFNLAKTIFK